MGTRLVVRQSTYRKRRWPLISFSVRRRSSGLEVAQSPECPLALTAVRRYWQVCWSGLAGGAWPLLEVMVANRGAQVVHSFVVRLQGPDDGPSNGMGIQPEQGFSPGAMFAHTSQEPTQGCVAVRVDFVQFVSGEVWCSQACDSLVTAEGLQEGRRAAVLHLLRILERSDSADVMAKLAGLHADVNEPVPAPTHGSFGFYKGVSNVAIRLHRAFERDGLEGVETLLRGLDRKA